MKFNVYEYQDEEQKTIPNFTIHADNIKEAVKIYQDDYSEYDNIETYFSDGDPYTALIHIRDKIIDSHDDHEITQEEYNSSIDYLNDERYYTLCDYAEITLSDEDRSYVIIENKLHKIDELRHYLAVNTVCENSIRDPKLIDIDSEKVKEYEKCGECFKDED